jgi:ACT domain-containing protein
MSQRIMQEFYTLIMIVNIENSKADFAGLSEKLKAVEQRLGVTIFVQHEDVFRYMHRV